MRVWVLIMVFAFLSFQISAEQGVYVGEGESVQLLASLSERFRSPYDSDARPKEVRKSFVLGQSGVGTTPFRKSYERRRQEMIEQGIRPVVTNGKKAYFRDLIVARGATGLGDSVPPRKGSRSAYARGREKPPGLARKYDSSPQRMIKSIWERPRKQGVVETHSKTRRGVKMTSTGPRYKYSKGSKTRSRSHCRKGLREESKSSFAC